MGPKYTMALADSNFFENLKGLLVMNNVFDFQGDGTDKEIGDYIDGLKGKNVFDDLKNYLSDTGIKEYNAAAGTALVRLREGLDTIKSVFNDLSELERGYSDGGEEIFNRVKTSLEHINELKDFYDTFNEETDFALALDPRFRLINAYIAQAQSISENIAYQAHREEVNEIEQSVETASREYSNVLGGVRDFVDGVNKKPGISANDISTVKEGCGALADKYQTCANVASAAIEDGKELITKDSEALKELQEKISKLEQENAEIEKMYNVDDPESTFNSYINDLNRLIGENNKKVEGVQAEIQELEKQKPNVAKEMEAYDKEHSGADLDANALDGALRSTELNLQVLKETIPQEHQTEVYAMMDKLDPQKPESVNKLMNYTYNKLSEESFKRLGEKEARLYNAKHSLNAADESLDPGHVYKWPDVQRFPTGSSARKNGVDIRTGYLQTLAFTEMMRSGESLDRLLDPQALYAQKNANSGKYLDNYLNLDGDKFYDNFAKDTYQGMETLVNFIDGKVAGVKDRFSFGALTKPENVSILKASSMLHDLYMKMTNEEFRSRAEKQYGKDNLDLLMKKADYVSKSIGFVRDKGEELIDYAEHDYTSQKSGYGTSELASRLVNLKSFENLIEETRQNPDMKGRLFSDIIVDDAVNFNGKYQEVSTASGKYSGFYAEKLDKLAGKVTSKGEQALNAVAKEALINPEAFKGINLSNFTEIETKQEVQQQQKGFFGNLFGAGKKVVQMIKKPFVKDDSFDGVIGGLKLVDGKGKTKEELYGKEYKDLDKYSDTLTNTKNAIDDYIANYKKKLDLQLKVNEKDVILDNLKEERQKFEKSLKDKIVEINNKIIDKNIAIKNLNKDSENKDNRIFEEKESRESRLKFVESQKEEVEKLKNEAGQLEESLKSKEIAKKQFENAEKKFKTLKATVDEGIGKLEEDQNRYDYHNEKYNSCAKKVQAVSKDADRRINGLKNHVGDIHERLQKFLNRFDKGKKEGHTNSDEYTAMKTKLEEALAKNDMASLKTKLEEIQTASRAYIDAKNAHPVPRIFASKMRYIRLAFAKELEQCAKNSTKELETVKSVESGYQDFVNSCKNGVKQFDATVSNMEGGKTLKGAVEEINSYYEYGKHEIGKPDLVIKKIVETAKVSDIVADPAKEKNLQQDNNHLENEGYVPQV